MFTVKNISKHDAILINDEYGRRAAFIKSGRVIFWNPLVSRKAISRAVDRPLDWSAQCTGRYAIAE